MICYDSNAVSFGALFNPTKGSVKTSFLNAELFLSCITLHTALEHRWFSLSNGFLLRGSYLNFIYLSAVLKPIHATISVFVFRCLQSHFLLSPFLSLVLLMFHLQSYFSFHSLTSASCRSLQQWYIPQCLFCPVMVPLFNQKIKSHWLVHSSKANLLFPFSISFHFSLCTCLKVSFEARTSPGLKSYCLGILLLTLGSYPSHPITLCVPFYLKRSFFCLILPSTPLPPLSQPSMTHQCHPLTWPDRPPLPLPSFFLLCSFLRSCTTLVLVLSVLTLAHCVLFQLCIYALRFSFSFHLPFYILFLYGLSGLP